MTNDPTPPDNEMRSTDMTTTDTPSPYAPGYYLALEAEIERLENRLAASEVNRTMVNSYRADLVEELALRNKNAQLANDWRDRYNRERLARDQFESRLRDTDAQLAELTAERDALRDAVYDYQGIVANCWMQWGDDPRWVKCRIDDAMAEIEAALKKATADEKDKS